MFILYISCIKHVITAKELYLLSIGYIGTVSDGVRVGYVNGQRDESESHLDKKFAVFLRSLLLRASSLSNVGHYSLVCDLNPKTAQVYKFYMTDMT